MRRWPAICSICHPRRHSPKCDDGEAIEAAPASQSERRPRKARAESGVRLRRFFIVQVCILPFLSLAIGLPCLAQSNIARQSFDPQDQNALIKDSIDNPGATPSKRSKSNQSAEDAAKEAFDGKQFLTSWRLNPAGYPLLSGIDAPSARAGIAWFGKSGEPGTSRLSEVSTVPSGFVTHGEDVFRLSLALLSLYSGKPNPGTEIGGPGPPVTAPTTRLGTGIAPEVAWAREGKTSPFIEIGSTPINGVVVPTFAGRFGAALHLGQTKVTPEVYRKSIAESILSYTGIVDPSTGSGFDRVVETGGKVEIERPLTTRWSLDASTSAGVERGVRVADNAHFSVELTPSYDLHLPHFDSFTIGPSYEFDRFNRNLSEFTLGQGGYFSP